ncbi:hypothetical protein D9758_003862 [Tetrapyrgos nigripes]|uniref:Uncharacterized protein n=1 Tax=Tetrapyrgos nigripes TaxID=182062 RepID=A0A8H5GLA8_9AGAR|nr:hypothetical protein D9758_003862 [Tetrapyrgos nigripes]
MRYMSTLRRCLSIAQEMGEHGITVNLYTPGPIDTEMTRSAVAGIGGSSDEATVALFRERGALKRFSEVTEIANPVSFIASKDSEFITACGDGILYTDDNLHDINRSKYQYLWGNAF